MAEISTLNGYKIKDKKAIRYYDTVADMVADTTLKSDMQVRTSGYYQAYDGGNAEYKIINDNTLIADNGSIHTLSNGLKAKLIANTQVNIKQFGAMADGTTDDTTAIQNALNKFKTVYIPEGIYKITTINLNDYNEIVGENKWKAILYSDSGDYAIRSDKRYLTLKNFQIKSDVEFSGSQSDNIDVGSGTGGIILNYTNNQTLNSYDTKIFVNDIIIDHCGGDGITIDGTVTGAHLTNIEVIVCGGTGYKINSTDTKLLNCISADCNDNGFDLIGSGSQVSNCKAFLCGHRNGNGYGFRITGTYTSGSNIQAEENYGIGIQVNSDCSILSSVAIDGSGNLLKYGSKSLLRIAGNNNIINGFLSNRTAGGHSSSAINIQKGCNNKLDFIVRELESMTRQYPDFPDMKYVEGLALNPLNEIILNRKKIDVAEMIDLFPDPENPDYVIYTKSPATATSSEEDGIYELQMSNASTLNSTGFQGCAYQFELDVDTLKANPYLVIEVIGKCGDSSRLTDLAITGTVKNGSNYHAFSDITQEIYNRSCSSEYADIFYLVDLSNTLNELTQKVTLNIGIFKISDDLDDNSISKSIYIKSAKYSYFSEI